MDYYQNLTQITQRTTEWYHQRSKIIGSTHVASILHLNSYHSYQELLEKQDESYPPKLKRITSNNLSKIDPITWGIVLEPIALKHLEQTTQHPIGSLGLRMHPKFNYLGASPDGLQIINDKPRLIEIKCPRSRQITYQVPLEYWIQVQIAMEVWDIDEALYCEYKFDLVVDKPKTQDLTYTYGLLMNGVYWIYQNSWCYLINRDKEWFNNIRCQLVDFYHLKFNMPLTNSKKRKRKNDHEVITKKNECKELMSINRLSNWLRDDPVLDWLDCHGMDQGYQKNKVPFLDFYNQLNLRFKLEVMSKCLKKAQENKLKYRVLNISLNNLLNINFNENIMLKLQYDSHLLEETKNSQMEGMDLILMGQLSKDLDNYRLWDTFEILIHVNAFNQIFPNKQFVLEEFLEDNNQLSYIPIKIKYTTLDFRTNSPYLRNKHKVDLIKIGHITSALILDRHYNFGIVPQNNNDDLISSGIKFIDNHHVQLNDLYPNMKNTYDGRWTRAKGIIAKDKEELTQISYLGVENRKILHKHGITKISQLTSNVNILRNIPGLKFVDRIQSFISSDLRLPPLTNIPRCQTEVYLDFESVNSLGTGQSLIFLMGILIKHNGNIEYKPYLVENLDSASETKMLYEGINFLSNLGNNIPIYHWSSAEPSLLRKSGWKLPSNCYWVDLYNHFVRNKAQIPECYSYGLKEVAARLYSLGKIHSSWLYGLDGTMAMVMAWNIHHKCKITGEKFCQDARIQKLCAYNYVDCKVLEEIRILL